MNYNPTLHKLSNGVTVILDPMELETVSVRVMFCTGERDELPHEYGLTHFCEHMLCKGTARFPVQKAVDDFLDMHGGTKNAGTGHMSVSFYGRILAENVNVLLEVLGDQIQNSLFDEKKIEIERQVIADELRRYLDKPAVQFHDFIVGKLFNNAIAPYSQALGPLENIMSFTREQMLEFLGRRLSARNCIIGISGKIIDPDAVLCCLEKTFAFLPQIDVPENRAIHYTPSVAHQSQPDKNNVKLRIFIPDICGNKFEDRFHNFCVGKFERFMIQTIYDIIRRENGLVYGFSSTDMGNEVFSLTGFDTETSAQNLERVVALIAKNAYKIYTENTITEEDLIRFECKNKLSDADFLETANRRCDRLLSFYRDYGRIYDFYETVKLGQSVHRDDVIAHSRGYFDGQMSIMTQGADFNADLKSVWVDNFK